MKKLRKSLNLIEIEKLLNFSYIDVEGNGFSNEKDIIKSKKEWRKKIGYSK